MCDFHSVIVTGDGRILHNADNSHSSVVHRYQLPNGLDAKWFECEWDGRGEFPPQLIQTRGKTSVPTGLAERAADNHYRKLARIVAGDLDPADPTAYPFNEPDYGDVRAVYRDVVIKREVAEKLAPIADMFEDMSDDSAINLIRQLVAELSFNMYDLATEEIEAAREEGKEAGDEEGYDRGRDDGYQSASEDLYTQEYVDEQIQEATEDLHTEEELEEAYAKGFYAAKNGSKPTVEYINGLPAFLFEEKPVATAGQPTAN